jgi:putative hydrolase of HD superfamily
MENNFLPFLREVVQIKQTVRTGWQRMGIQRPESVSDHMYFMALMALTATPEHLDKSRCIQIAIVHDLAECIVGDITPTQFSGISKEQKHRMEKDAMHNITNLLPGKSKELVLELYDEYENQTSPEAQWVKDLDKLEMVHQAMVYESRDGVDLSGFFKSIEGKVHTDRGKEIENEIREEYSKNKQK